MKPWNALEAVADPVRTTNTITAMSNHPTGAASGEESVVRLAVCLTCGNESDKEDRDRDNDGLDHFHGEGEVCCWLDLRDVLYCGGETSCLVGRL